MRRAKTLQGNLIHKVNRKTQDLQLFESSANEFIKATNLIGRVNFLCTFTNPEAPDSTKITLYPPASEIQPPLADDKLLIYSRVPSANNNSMNNTTVRLYCSFYM